MWQTVATVALTTLITLIITFLWNFITNKTKRAINKKKEADKEFLTEVVNECLDPINKRLDSIEQNNRLIKKGLQSELRVELRERYDYWIKKGYAPSTVRADIESVYQSYHNLGENGVMDDLHNKFLALPIEKKINKGE